MECAFSVLEFEFLERQRERERTWSPLFMTSYIPDTGKERNDSWTSNNCISVNISKPFLKSGAHRRMAAYCTGGLTASVITGYMRGINKFAPVSVNPLKPQWILYVPTGFILKNSTFCPHSVFMCFVWIWEQTAIISLYSINWLVFITETECVYCAVRTGYLYIILRSAHTVYLCVLCGSENKQRLFPYTALTDWFL